MEASKKPALYRLAKLLAEAQVPYAIIGGIALQVRQEEPRTTLDIDLAVLSRDRIPAARLTADGFVQTGDFPHSQNWIGPGQVPVQFTDDPALHEAVTRADALVLDDVPLRVLRVEDLLHEKLRAAADPARRRSKRLQDLADAHSLLEQDPSLRQQLSEQERDQLDRAGP